MQGGGYCFVNALHGEFFHAAVMIEWAAGLVAGAAVEVLGKHDVLTTERTGGDRVTGTEECHRGEPEMGSEVGDCAVVGDEEGAMWKGVEETAKINLIRKVLHITVEAFGELVGFVGTSRIGEDDQFDLVVFEQGFSQFAKAIDVPPVGGAQDGSRDETDADGIWPGWERRRE